MFRKQLYHPFENNDEEDEEDNNEVDKPYNDDISNYNIDITTIPIDISYSLNESLFQNNHHRRHHPPPLANNDTSQQHLIMRASSSSRFSPILEAKDKEVDNNNVPSKSIRNKKRNTHFHPYHNNHSQQKKQVEKNDGEKKYITTLSLIPYSDVNNDDDIVTKTIDHQNQNNLAISKILAKRSKLEVKNKKNSLLNNSLNNIIDDCISRGELDVISWLNKRRKEVSATSKKYTQQINLFSQTLDMFKLK